MAEANDEKKIREMAQKPQKVPTLNERAVSHVMKNDLENLKKDVEEYGFDLKSKDHYGRTPLMYASISGSEDVIRYILSHQEISASLLEQVDPSGLSAMHWACNTVNVNIHTIELLRSLGSDLEQEDYGGNTPLIYCLHAGNNVACLDAMLKMGANPNHQNLEAQTPLDICQTGVSGGMKVPNRKKMVSILERYTNTADERGEVSEELPQKKVETADVAIQVSDMAFQPKNPSIIDILLCRCTVTQSS